MLRVPKEEIIKEDGIHKIILKLNELYKKDSILSKFQTLDSFKTFKHPSGMSLQKFINEFDRRLYNVKTFGTTMSSNILGYRLLKAANLSPNDEHLIKATLTQTLHYSFVKELLKQSFSDSRQAVAQNNYDFIKTLFDITFQSNVP